MLKRVKAAVIVCAALCAMFALAGCASQETYTPQLKDATVSSPAIGESGTLRVGVNTSNPPLAGMVSDRIVGLDVDIAAALADELGLKLAIVDTGSNPTSALQQGTVDLVMGVDASDSSVVFWRTDAYLPTGVVAFATSPDTAAPAAESDAKFAAQVSSKSAWAVMNTFGDDSLTSTADLPEAFSALVDGSVQYVAADAIIGEYAAHGAGIEVYPVAALQKPSGYCVGVSASNTDLQKAVSTALKKLSDTGVIGVIEMKWLGAMLDLTDVPVIEEPKKEEEEPAEGEDREEEAAEDAAA